MPDQTKKPHELETSFSAENQSLLILEMQIQAFDYYVVSRWACQQRLVDIVGSLLHHAFERLLKSGLVGHVPLSQMVSKKHYGHDIPKLWGRFKNVYNIERQDFDALASLLHSFEDYRYPEKNLENSDVISISGMGYFVPSFKLRDKPGEQLILEMELYASWWEFIRKVASLDFDENSSSIGPDAISVYRWKPGERG